MDRGRESRRGGGASGTVSGHHASSRRRPRSGFKDSAVVCEEEEGLNESPDSTRLRERSSSNNNNISNSKKERSGLSSSRNKRKRHGLHHERFRGSSRDRDRDHDGGDESSEESAGDEDEDEDDEPPRPPPNPRRATKFKSQCKVSDEMIGVGLISVPRKARSAAMKRAHDSSSATATTITVTAVASDGGGHQRQKSPSPARPSVIPASPSSSNASVKPGRRMKLIGTKHRPSKITKVSHSISEREVEVAEVLFGLTRQLQNHHHHSSVAAAESYANASKSDVKESSNDASAAAHPDISRASSPMTLAPPSSSVVSPPPISSPVSPPSASPAISLPQQSTSIPATAMAPKRKRPRPVKTEEASSAVAMRPPASVGGVSGTHTTVNGASATRNDCEPSQVTKMEIHPVMTEPNAAFSGKGIPLVVCTASALASTCGNFNPISSPPPISNQSDAPIVSEKIVATNIADSKPTTSEKIVEANVPDLKVTCEKILGNKTAEMKMTCEKTAGAKSAELKSVVNEKTVGNNIAESMSTSTPSAEKKPSDISDNLEKMAPEVSEAPAYQNATEEVDTAASYSPLGPELKAEAVKMLQSPKIENTFEEKFKIDLMAPPGKSFLDTEDDNGPDAVSNAVSEAPEKGTVEITNILEVKAVAVKEEREPEKREDVKLEETEKKHDKKDNGEEKVLEKHNVKERNIDSQLEGEKLEKDSSNPLAQKQSRISKNESRVEKSEKSATAAMGNASSSSSVVASMPIPMTVASWPAGLHALGRYFGPAAAASWPGAPSLPGVVPMEGTSTTPALQPAYILPQQSRQTWKRCATHSYIAHFIIECQQRMVHHPFWHAPNYGNPVAVYGGKPYNLNIPLPPPPEIINLGGSLPGPVSVASTGNSGSIGSNLDSSQDRNVGPASFGAFTGQNGKVKIAPSYMDARKKHPSYQQTAQQSTSTIIQQGPPGFGFPSTQSVAGGANSSTACSTGNSSSLGNAAGLGTAPSGGTVGGNSNLTSICTEPQYMAMIQQNAYPFGINTPAHFGTAFNGNSNHIGQQQAAQFFNSPFYATQLLHAPHPQPQPQPQPQSQQHGSQNPSTSSGSSSSQKHQQHLQGSCNFSAPQKQHHQGTPSPSPSNSQQHHHLPASQARQIEREANNGADSPSTADSRIPLIQKNFYSQGSPSNSNFNVNSSPLLATGVHQEFTFMAALGAKHNGKQQQQQHSTPQIQHQSAPGYTIQQHHGNDPTLQMNLKALEVAGQSQAQAIAALSRSSGLLGFSSMAQGHPMLQGMPDSARHQLAAQAQQNAIQSGPQQQHSGQMQRTQSTSSGEGRIVTDSMSNAGGRGREEEQKSPIKGGLGHSMKSSRIETENSANTHGGSLIDGGLSTSLAANSIENMGRTLNMITSGANGIRHSHSTGSSSHSNTQPPSSQQLNQNTKQTVGRAKSVPSPNIPQPVTSAQTTLPSYGDRTGKFQASQASPPFTGQNLKQGQQSHQWKISPRTASTMPTAAGAPSQATLATMKNFPQQGRNQQGNATLGASLVAPSQASFVTKSSGQPPVNQQINSGSIMAPRLPSANSVPASVVGSPPVSKSVSTPTLRTATGSKGPISQQKSIAPVSNKKSSPVGSRSTPSVLGPSHISQSSSGKSTQQQFQQQPQQSVSLMASGQPVGLKSQPYHNQAHFTPQQLLFAHGPYLQQQALQQSQFSPQSAHQVSGLHQKQQMQGSNSPQTSFSNPHLRQQQEQQQQMQPGSSTSSNSGTLSLASPTLTLGGGPTKTNPGGSHGVNLHAQYSGQHQSDVLNQDQINGVQMLQNSANLCTSSVQSRNPFNASSPQASSIRMASGNLKKSGGNIAEGMSSPGGLSLSMALSSGVRTHNSALASSVSAMQHAKATSVSSTAVHSGQMPSISIHQPSVPLAAGPINSGTSTPPGLHGQAATSVVQP